MTTESAETLAPDEVRLEFHTTGITLAPVAPAEADKPAVREFSAMILPWGAVTGDYRKLSFNEGSVKWDSKNVSRVKLLSVHDSGQLRTLIGVATKVWSEKDGLHASFRLASTEEADLAWTLLQDEVLDGVSVGVSIDYKGLVYDDSEGTYTVTGGAVLKETSLVPIPAFADARVSAGAAVLAAFAALTDTAPAVSSFNEGESVNENTNEAAAPIVASVDTAALTEALNAGNVTLGTQIAEGILAGLRADREEALAAAATEGAAAAPGGRGTTAPREQYSFGEGDANGASWLKDLATSKYGDKYSAAYSEASGRLEAFSGMVRDGSTAVFAAQTRSDLAPITPTLPRQDLYVGQLGYGRPLYDAVSSGSLPTDAPAQPFTLPKFVSSSNLSQDHTEGTNSTAGTISLTTQTVTPTTVDGLYQGTREIFESSTPMLDQIVRAALLRAYEEKIETRIRARLAAVNFANVTVTAATATLLGDALGKLYTQQLFQRGGYRINRTVSSLVPYLLLVNGKDSSGRPLFPELGVTNADGSKSAGVKALNVKGEVVVPAYSLVSSGANTTGDTGEMFSFASESVFEWTSPLRSWTFEERNGPSVIEIAVFGYEAGAVIRDSDVIEINTTIA